MKHIIRIANADLPGKKPIGIALRKIRGVGFMFANMACRITSVNPLKKAGALTDKEAEELEDVIIKPGNHNVPAWFLNRQKDYETGEDKHILGPTIKFVQDNDVRRLQKIKSYRGMRHAAGLPTRGQRTRSNFRKNKGKTVGVKKAGKQGKKG
ncbi:30S ribosomal protein S13 [Candidatus Woesearchaeota archaeon CG10_big_fil_rev_8_21_14_0_10_34_8]|nr:MAG: 30S ribosomal protein S13 [Candidatus Woesearchaeota archaeon CG10_big_fil_rev_8_21_14_0_10_34_8]